MAPNKSSGRAAVGFKTRLGVGFWRLFFNSLHDPILGLDTFEAAAPGEFLRLICCCKHLAGPRRKLPGFLLSNPAGVIRIFEQLAEHSERSFRRIIVVDDGRI